MELKCMVCEQVANPLHKIRTCSEAWSKAPENFCAVCVEEHVDANYHSKKECDCAGCGLSLVVYDQMEGRRFCSWMCRMEFNDNHYKKPVVREEKACGHCGESFTPKRKDAKTCSPKCRVAASRKAERDRIEQYRATAASI